MMIKCGLLPGESRAVVERRNEPLRLYLERSLGCRVQLIVGASYVHTGEALRRGEIDIAYLGPVTYILQSRLAELEPFARPTHIGASGPTFQAVIIVPSDSPLVEVEQLRGCEVAMGDLVSTSGSWVPRYMLLERGLVADRDYFRRSLGAHDAVADAVAAREVAAGCLSKTVYERLLTSGRVDPDRVRVLAESAPIPEYLWTFRAGLGAALRADLRAAFHELRDPAVLDVYRACAFIPAVDADVDRVRHWMECILDARLQPGAVPHPSFAGGSTLAAAPTTAARSAPRHLHVVGRHRTGA
jgi:phosphonate transport system substrate-binding protein